MKKVVSVTSNLVATSVAAVLSASLIMSGTWAWQSFDQEALNKSKDTFDAGGRIHTNFNGELKEVFVENYKEVGDGNDIFVRVRMEEYLEIGELAGIKDPSERDMSLITVLGNADADINNPDTWDVIYMEDNGDANGFDEARPYVGLVLGGQSVYMPTFNKNDDSREGIINGTLAGLDGKDRELDDAYSDYVKYALSPADGITEKEDWAIYDMDDNDIEEEDPVVSTDSNILDNSNIYKTWETHYSKETLDATKVISMKDWMIMFDEYETYSLQIKEDPDLADTLPEVESPIGTYWVFDTDGWVYWAQPLAPQTATGLLLKETVSYKKYEGIWYYEVSTRAQYATRGDWGQIVNDVDVNGHWGSDSTNAEFDDQSVTESALVLLQTISGTVIR